MIRSFKCNDTEHLWSRQRSLKFGSFQRVALRKLAAVHYAAILNDLMVPPGNHLEALSGDRRGQYSIRINQQWRVCFEWKDGDAYNVEIVDYH